VGSVVEPFDDAKTPKETLSMNFARKALISGAMLGATIAGGAVGASFLGTAGAQTETSSTTAATATKVTVGAQGAVAGATVDRVENDAEGATYEAHMTKSDGSKVTVKVNADFSVASVGDGMR